MAVFDYTIIDKDSEQKQGTIEAINEDAAINSLQRRGFVIVSITPGDKKNIFQARISFFERASTKDVVILSRQISTLFEAQVSVLKVFSLLAAESENVLLRDTLTEVADDLQGGSSISKALDKHPKVFSPFYVNMVRAGEESGQLDKTFSYLADYLDRNYELTSRAKNALVYPAFVIATFIGVMVLMLTTVIPSITQILIESGQEIPFYTKLVIGLSNLFVNFGVFMAIILIFAGYFFVRWIRTDAGSRSWSDFKLSIPFLGNLYRKLYLSRLADNMNTMLVSGIAMVRAVEVTAAVVDNKTYEDLLLAAAESIKGGQPVSKALGEFEQIPSIMIQMIRVGEETGELGNILKTLSAFYRREVLNAVDTLVGLIEPIMIVLLGAGVGILLASVLIPIYNLSNAI